MAERKVSKTPKMALKMPWKTAIMDPSAAVMAPKMEEMKDPMESTREGMLSVCLFICLFVWLVVYFFGKLALLPQMTAWRIMR